ncbi:MAG: hypothetical protein R3E95_22020 [Thiolinea sp.]
MRSILALSLVTFLTTSCALPMTEGGDGADGATSDAKRDIQSVTFIQGSPPLSAELRRNQTLVVNSDLSTSLKVTNGYNAVLSEKSGTVTQAQFDAISEKLNSVDYIYLKPLRLEAPLVGGGTETVVITSDLGAHRFASSPTTRLPPLMQELYDNRSQYLPQ